MTSLSHWIGVDISKRFLDVYIPGGKVLRVANDDEGRKSLVERLTLVPVAGIVLEATGGLERPVLTAMVQARLPASVVNPARVRAFAEGTGQLAKTDRIDAQLLSAYGAYIKPVPTALPSSARANLHDLIAYRSQITQEITARTAQAALYRTPDLVRRAQAAIAALRAERSALEKEMKTLIASEADLPSPSIFSCQPHPWALSWERPSSQSCPNLVASIAARLRRWQGSRRSRVTAATGEVIAAFAVAGAKCDAHCSMQPASPSSTTRPSKRSTSGFGPTENPARSLSWPLCTSSSPS
jgi:Transposase